MNIKAQISEVYSNAIYLKMMYQGDKSANNLSSILGVQ